LPIKSPCGAKTELILDAIEGTGDSFSVAGIQAKCPGVNVDMIRKLLKKERSARKLECMGLRRDARWRRKKPKNR